jgi:hypothetical protein
MNKYLKALKTKLGTQLDRCDCAPLQLRRVYTAGRCLINTVLPLKNSQEGQFLELPQLCSLYFRAPIGLEGESYVNLLLFFFN